MAVYFIADDTAGLFKVGFTQEVARRFDQIRRGNNNPVRLIGAIQEFGRVHEGVFHAFLTEKGLHRRLEWFDLNDVSAAFLNYFLAHYLRCIDGDSVYWRDVWPQMTPGHLEGQAWRAWDEAHCRLAGLPKDDPLPPGI